MAKRYISEVRLKYRKLQAKHQPLKTNTLYVDLGPSHPCQGLIIEFTSQSLIFAGSCDLPWPTERRRISGVPFPNLGFQEPGLFFFVLLCTCYFLDHEKNLPRLACWLKQDRRQMEQNQPRPAVRIRAAQPVQISHTPAHPIHRAVKINGCSLEPLSFVVIYCAELLQQ